MNSNVTEIDRNVERMGEIIVQMGKFTEKQLLARLRKENVLSVFPLFWTVRRYLKSFLEMGALRSVNNHYEVV